MKTAKNLTFRSRVVKKQIAGSDLIRQQPCPADQWKWECCESGWLWGDI